MAFKSKRDLKGFGFETESEILRVLGLKQREKERLGVLGYRAMEESRGDRTRKLWRG